MPDYPPGIEPAVRDAIAAKLPVGTSWNTDVTSLARAALDAAAPLLLAASVAETIERQAERIRSQASQLHMKDEALARKNRELDALHMVWCDGGCRGGVHRWTDEKITGELVAIAERNAKRLRHWYDAVKWRLEHYGAGQATDLHGRTFVASQWHEDYARRNAEKTDLACPAPEGEQQ